MEPHLTPSPGLTRTVLDGLPHESIHRSRNWSKADVYLVEWPVGSATRVVVKDMKRCPLWFRLVAGRAFLRRERRVLEALDGMSGVPAVIAQPDADSLVIEYCEGTPLSRVKRSVYPPEATPLIVNLIHQLHERGVTHGDLHDDNILLQQREGKVCIALLDWATAQVWGIKRNAVKERLFNEFRMLDERAIAKVKMVYAIPALTDKEVEILETGGTTLYQAVKKVRRKFDKLRGKKKTTHFEKRMKIVYEEREKLKAAAQAASKPGEGSSSSG